MKKIYLTTIFTLLSLGLFAQVNLFSDFESNSDPFGWTSWQTNATVDVVANPSSTTVNSSDYVIKLVSSADDPANAATAWGSLNTWKNGGLSFVKPTTVSVLVNPSITTTVKLDLQNSVSTAANAEFYINSVPSNTWTKLEFDVSSLSVWDYQNITFQMEGDMTTYFDDIKVHYDENSKTTDGGYIVSSFESNDGIMSVWDNWGGSHSVIANPHLTAGNTSANVLEYVPGGAWQAVKMTFQTGLFGEKPTTIKVKVYSDTESTVQLSLTDGSNAAQEDIGKTISANQWNELEFDVSAITAWDYNTIVFQNSEIATYYFDDLTVYFSGTSTGINEPKTNKAQDFNVTTANSQIKVQNCNGSNVAVYSLSGAKVFSQDNAGGTVSVNVAPGLYIVVVDNISTKVIVK
jgi:hypothetical protein